MLRLTWTQVGDTYRATRGDHEYVITNLGADWFVVRKGWHGSRVPSLHSAQRLAEAWEAGIARSPGAWPE